MGSIPTQNGKNTEPIRPVDDGAVACARFLTCVPALFWLLFEAKLVACGSVGHELVSPRHHDS